MKITARSLSRSLPSWVAMPDALLFVREPIPGVSGRVAARLSSWRVEGQDWDPLIAPQEELR